MLRSKLKLSAGGGEPCPSLPPNRVLALSRAVTELNPPGTRMNHQPTQLQITILRKVLRVTGVNRQQETPDENLKNITISPLPLPPGSKLHYEISNATPKPHLYPPT